METELGRPLFFVLVTLAVAPIGVAVAHDGPHVQTEPVGAQPAGGAGAGLGVDSSELRAQQAQPRTRGGSCAGCAVVDRTGDGLSATFGVGLLGIVAIRRSRRRRRRPN